MPMTRQRTLLFLGGALLTIACLAAWWGYAHLTRLVESELRRYLGSDLTIGSVEMGWDRIALRQVAVRRHGPGSVPCRLRIEALTVSPSLRSLLSRRLLIRDIRIDRPTLLIEISPDGSIVKPLQPPRAEEKARQEGAAGKGTPFTLTVDRLEIVDGTIELLDWQVARLNRQRVNHPQEQYHLLRFPGVAFKAGRLDYPAGPRKTPLDLSLTAPGGGTLHLKGAISAGTLDGDLDIKLRSWDITRFRPYFEKPGDMPVKKGILGADCAVRIDRRRLNAPGTLGLKELEVDPAGAKGLFLGMPAKAVIWFLANNRDEIVVNFNVAGNLDNPRFKAKQALVEQVATALAGKMGIPVLGTVGKGLVDLGAKGLKGIKGLFGGGKR